MSEAGVRFKARLVALLRSSSAAYLVLRILSDAGFDSRGATEESGTGVDGGGRGDGRMSLKICAGSGFVSGRWTGAGVEMLVDRLSDGVACGRVEWPVRFIINTGFVGLGMSACEATRPAAGAALPETAANGGDMASPVVELVTTG